MSMSVINIRVVHSVMWVMEWSRCVVLFAGNWLKVEITVSNVSVKGLMIKLMVLSQTVITVDNGSVVGEISVS